MVLYDIRDARPFYYLINSGGAEGLCASVFERFVRRTHAACPLRLQSSPIGIGSGPIGIGLGPIETGLDPIGIRLGPIGI